MKISLLLAITALAAVGGGAAPAQPSACRPIRFENTPFTVCTAARGRYSVTLMNRGAGGVPMRDFKAIVAALGKDAPRVAFAMNAGMFGVTGLPIGLYVERGRREVRINRRTGHGNFYTPPPNGIFYGDARGWHIATADAFAAHGPASPDFATQSGPTLLIGGAINPGFDENGVSLNIRNGAGIAATGDALFAISDAPVSFGRFARLFRRLGCADALYFDGAVSSLWDPASGRIDRRAQLGPIVVVLQKR